MSEPRSTTDSPTSAAPSPKAAPSRKRQEKSQKTQPASLASGREIAEGPAQASRTGNSPSTVEQSIPGRVVSLTAIDRDGMISVAAYYRSEQRNFAPGFELEDWLAAEAEIDALLLGSTDADTKPLV